MLPENVDRNLASSINFAMSKSVTTGLSDRNRTEPTRQVSPRVRGFHWSWSIHNQEAKYSFAAGASCSNEKKNTNEDLKLTTMPNLLKQILSCAPLLAQVQPCPSKRQVPRAEKVKFRTQSQAGAKCKQSSGSTYRSDISIRKTRPNIFLEVSILHLKFGSRATTTIHRSELFPVLPLGACFRMLMLSNIVDGQQKMLRK